MIYMVRHCSKCKVKKQVLVSEYFIIRARKFSLNQLCDNLLRKRESISNLNSTFIMIFPHISVLLIFSIVINVVFLYLASRKVSCENTKIVLLF